MSNVRFTKEQQSAIDARGVNVLVSAAAGSGKTAVLTERIVKMLLPPDGVKPVDADKLLVVTFTRAAAGEMKERIEKSLKNELRAAVEDSDFARRKLITNQIKKLSVAKITTIDSFCQGLVKEYFHILDIDPAFSVIMEYESASINDEVFENMVAQLYKEQNEDFLLLLNNYCPNGSEAKIREMVYKLTSFTSSFPYPEKFISEKAEEYACASGLEGTVWFLKINEKYRRDVKKLVEIYNNAVEAVPDGAEWEKVLRILNEERERVKKLDGINIDEAIQLINNFEFERFIMPKNADKSICDILKNYRDNAKAATGKIPGIIAGDVTVTETFLRERIYPFAKALSNITIRFIKETYEYKKNRSVLDFSDIARMAYRLLAENEEIRKIQRKRYSEILIDEYQDTNRLQDSLFEMISNGNNLFMVGDMKQSIYRFRKSDPLVFRNKSDTYNISGEAKERKIILSSNFRSRSTVIDSVNELFEAVMTRGVGELDYDDEQKLYTGNGEYSDNGCDYTSECIIISSDGEKTDSDKRQEAEAEFIAARIIKLVKEGFVVYDKDTKSERAVEYSDIAILMSSHKNAFPIYKKVFDKYGIVFSCETEGFFSTPEIKLMMSLLRVIENPQRDVPMLAVLRSCVGGFTDDEIAVLRACYPKKSFYGCLMGAYSRFVEEEQQLDKKGYELGMRIVAFFEKLSLWRDRARFMSADRLVRMLYENTGIYAFFSAASGEDATANLRLFFDRARNCEQNGFSGLYKFLRHMERVEKSGKDMEGARAFSGVSSVRLMTIHKSKGLEMPVVFLAGCGREFNTMSANGRMLMHTELGFSMDYISYQNGITVKSPIHDIIADEINIELKSEEMRKLYVALTRAREKLIVTASLGEAASDDVAGWKKKDISNLKETACDANRFIDWIAPVAINSDEWKFGVYKNESKDVIQDKEKLVVEEMNIDIDACAILDYKYPYAAAGVKSKSAVSDFKGVVHNNAELMRKPSFLKEKSMGGADYGTAMHLILEKIPKNAVSDVESIMDYIGRLAEDGEIDEAFVEMIDAEKIFNFYNSDIGKRLLMADFVSKESEFEISVVADELYDEPALKDEYVLLQGVIDCWFVEDDEIVIVDYKTDRVNDIEEIHQKYDIQLALYAKALEKITKKKVKEKFIYLFSRETVVQC